MLQSVRNSISRISNKASVYTPNQLAAAGFNYTGDGDTAVCNDCKLKRSNWTLDMNPLAIHSEQQPNCSFVVRSKAVSLWISSPWNTNLSDDNQQNPSKRRKVEINDLDETSNTLFEVSSLIQARRRTFSHWPHRTIPSSERMIKAGFFGCNVRDRVICLYCNLICQQWTAFTDDPCEVHRTLSPNCIYVKAKLLHPSATSLLATNENLRSVSVNTLINRSLQNWDAKDLCGDELHRKIQEFKRVQQQRVRINESVNNNMTNISLSKFVGARLDLSVSQRLFDEGFKLPIIKRCWEDQLQLKQSDFVSNTDLYMACLILQKQIELIDDTHDNIIVPSIRMQQIRQQNEIRTRRVRQALGLTTVNNENI